jgi:hypothetical protein
VEEGHASISDHICRAVGRHTDSSLHGNQAGSGFLTFRWETQELIRPNPYQTNLEMLHPA